MSKLFKLFGQSDKKHKTVKKTENNDEETPVNFPPSFERRISVSNSGRWKQKKARDKVKDEMFKSETDKKNNGELKGAVWKTLVQDNSNGVSQIEETLIQNNENNKQQKIKKEQNCNILSSSCTDGVKTKKVSIINEVEEMENEEIKNQEEKAVIEEIENIIEQIIEKENNSSVLAENDIAEIETKNFSVTNEIEEIDREFQSVTEEFSEETDKIEIDKKIVIETAL